MIFKNDKDFDMQYMNMEMHCGDDEDISNTQYNRYNNNDSSH